MTLQAGHHLHAHGKILLTGEYLVMFGATALAIPLAPGHSLSYEYNKYADRLTWEAHDPRGKWFSGDFLIHDFSIIESSDDLIANRLQSILSGIRTLNPLFPGEGSGIHVTTLLEFNRDWGFGSSSSLISLLASWAGVDPMHLHRLVSGGSGYDVACSGSDTPILYKIYNGRPEISEVSFMPDFAENLMLVYLGAKQNSESEVQAFKKRSGAEFKDEIKMISEISKRLSEETRIESFMNLLQSHETIMGKVLGRETVKELLFPDFDGVVKSLGAWGGDFILAVSTKGSAYINDYFTRNSYRVILPFQSVTLIPDEKKLLLFNEGKV